MSTHDSKAHGLLLEELVTSADDIAVAFADSELAGCEDCRSEIEAHLATLDDLEALGRDERGSIEAALALDVVPARAERLVRERILLETQRVDSAARPKFGWLAALAAVLVFGLFVRSMLQDSDTETERDDQMLGADAGLLHPVEGVDSFAPFRWNVVVPTNGYVIVRVEGDGLEIESPRIVESSWTPDFEGTWPKEIHWTLEVYRGTGAGDVVATFAASARRSSP